MRVQTAPLARARRGSYGVEMRLSQVLESLTRVGDGWAFRAPADWMQGRSAFGGLQAAFALRAMRPLAGPAPLRVLQTTFIAPVPEGEARIATRLLRAGKSTTHAEARILVGDELAAIVVGVFGASRPSEIRVAPRRRPRPDGESTVIDRARADLPVFIRHFAVRWLRGDAPGAGSPVTDPILEVDVDDEGAATEAHVVAIADLPPPVALSMLSRVVPASSLTWTLEMVHAGKLEDLGLAGWQLDLDIVAGADGYTSQSEIVWAPDGKVAALSRQCMVVFG